MKRVTILGSTGSIGVNTLNVIRQHRDRFEVFALVAGGNLERLAEQVVEFRPRLVVIATEERLPELRERLRFAGIGEASLPELDWGPAGRVRAAAAPEADIVISAIVGVAGLEATYEAVRRGKRVGLAAKEVLVACGRLVMEASRAAGSELIPVDSEHNGVHQCMRAGRRSEVRRVILTASGGPFRDTPKEQLALVTPAQALQHPTWRMGKRITVDSATMMNKGFEVIEACWLFDLKPQEVEVLIHPQSTVHALVEFRDGSVIAQISATDMRMPIQYALTWPERAEAPAPRLDWGQLRKWEFYPPDFEKFPLLKLAYQAQEAGPAATCVLNAADEVAVEAFLDGRIGFLGIPEIVEETLARVRQREPQSVAEVLELDRQARLVAQQLVGQRAGAEQPAARK